MKPARLIKLFIVEDSFLYSHVITETLQQYANFKISSFSNADDCIRLLDNNPEVIILDYNLDDSNTGMDVLKIIRSRKPNTKVIILSAQTDIQVAADLLKEGAFDYIPKNNHPEAMQKLTNSVLKALEI